MSAEQTIVNALSIDVEEYFQVSNFDRLIDRAEWERLPSRVEGSISRILDDLEQFVGERVGLDFILNAILTRDSDLHQCVAGHFIQAHRAGVRVARQGYGVPVAKRYQPPERETPPPRARRAWRRWWRW